MTNKQALQLVKNDVVILRNDGRVIQDELGNIKTFPSNDDFSIGKREVEKLMQICKKLKINYTFELVKYTDLPKDKKY